MAKFVHFVAHNIGTVSPSQYQFIAKINRFQGWQQRMIISTSYIKGEGNFSALQQQFNSKVI